MKDKPDDLELPATPIHSAGQPLSLLSRGVALFGLFWVVLAMITLVFGFVAPSGLFQDELLPLWARVVLASTELTALAIVAAVAAGIWVLCEMWISSAVSRWRRWTARAFRCVAVGTLLFACAGSWAQFCQTGQFLDRLSIGFAAYNIGSLWHYAVVMYPIILAAIPLVALAVAVTATEVLPRWLERRPGVLRRFSWCAMAAAALSALLALGGDVARRASRETVVDLDTGIVYPLGEFYRFRRDYRAGPVTHFIASLFDVSMEPGDEGAPRRPVKEISRPICRMNEYLAGVEDARLNRINVVLILIDSLRADQLRAYGSPREVMPELEALARESRVFTDCISPASHTDYAAPSFLSSHYPLRAADHHRYPRYPSYPRVLVYDILKPFGYRTGVFSSQSEKWGGMAHYLKTPALDCFFDADSFARKPPDDPEAKAVARESRKNPDPHIDDRFTMGEALKWLETTGEGPFFIYLNLQSAHSPYILPPGFAPRFASAPRDFEIGYAKYPRERVKDVKDFYADSLAYVDAQIGRLFGHLKKRGHWDRSLIVVSGDHGEAFFEHGFAAHGGALYDEVVRVPLLVRVPGLPAGLDSRPAQILDVPPTICHALGLPFHPSYQGVDLLSARADPERSRYIIAQSPLARQIAIVRGGYKLIFDGQERRYILYDVAKDPGERFDVSGQRPLVLADLKGRLVAWFEAHVEYYGDRSRHAVEYPPVLVED